MKTTKLMTYCNLIKGLVFCSLILSAWEGQAVVLRPAYDGSWRWTRQTTGSNDFAVCRMEPGAGPSGGAALHLKDEVTGRVNNVLTCHFAASEIAPLRGRTVWLSMRVRQAAANTTTSVGFSLGAYGAKGVARSIGTGTTSETPWQTLQVKVRVPDDARSVKVNFNCAGGWGGTGEAWFADWVLTDEREAVPKMEIADYRAFPEFAYRLEEAADPTPSRS